jgi:hypothetical protein
VRAALERLRTDVEHVLELRALHVPTRYGAAITAAGWFDDLDLLAQEAAKLDRRGAQLYVTLNPVAPALLCRGFNRIVERPKSTTGDAEILKRVWLPIDIDPVRPSGVSASAAEIEIARARTLDVSGWLRERVAADPTIWAFSGNGFHLLYRVDLPNDEASTNSVKAVIDEAAAKFSDNVVSIDRTVFNAARIWRLYGTLNRKGDDVPKLGRVHRRAAILGEGLAP